MPLSSFFQYGYWKACHYDSCSFLSILLFILKAKMSYLICIFLNYSALCFKYMILFSGLSYIALYIDLNKFWCFSLNVRILSHYYFFIARLCSLIPFIIFLKSNLNFVVVLDIFYDHLFFTLGLSYVICMLMISIHDNLGL